MIQVDIHHLQAELERLLEQGKLEEIIQLCKGGVPVAQLHWMARPWADEKGQRPFGLGQGQIQPGCFEPLPDDLLDAFEGKQE